MEEKLNYDDLYKAYMRQPKNELAALLAKRDIEDANKPKSAGRTYTMSVASL